MLLVSAICSSVRVVRAAVDCVCCLPVETSPLEEALVRAIKSAGIVSAAVACEHARHALDSMNDLESGTLEYAKLAEVSLAHQKQSFQIHFILLEGRLVLAKLELCQKAFN